MIVAYDEKRGIGANNDLLWKRDLPADLARFKHLTTGNTIIMGRTTFEGIGRALPDRENIVVSYEPIEYEGAHVALSLDEAFSMAHRDIYVCGGASIYAQSLPYVDEVLATEVHAVFSQADTFFSELSADEWREVSREAHAADKRNKYAYDFVTYRRI